MGIICCCCASKPNQEKHPLNTQDSITYQSVAPNNSQYPALLVDNQVADPKYDNQHGIQRMDDEYQSELFNELELNLSLRNIPQRKMFTCPCDPFIIVSIKDETKNVYNVIGQTEIIDDNPNCDFSKHIRLDYMFEQVQYVRLDIYDANEDDDDDDDDDNRQIKTTELNKYVHKYVHIRHHFVGAVEFIVGDLVTADGQKLVMAVCDKNGKKLAQNKRGQPMVIIRSQDVTNNFDEIELQLSSQGLPRLKCCGGISPFFQIYRQINKNEWASCYKSEYIKHERSPNWKPFSIQTRRLCDGDVEKTILIKIWDWNHDALPVFACELKTNMAQLLESSSITYDTRNCGELLIKKAKIIKKYSFVSFLKGGLEIHFMTAIDFTGSNGDPNQPDSLHYMGPPNYESQYLKVIKSIGRVLAPYDVDGDIHAYGFGANLNPLGKKNVSHCFPLTYPSQDASVDGVDGLIEVYKNVLNKIQLYGPTYMSEIISNAAAKSINICRQNSQSYNILLIITDGQINDLQKTVDALVTASSLALSIVLVGVGNENFDNMDSLDADDDPLIHSKTGEIMKRCIVKFVPFNEFKNHHISIIAKETLEEIPEQVSSFMSMNNIHPNTPRTPQNNQNNNDDQKTNNNNNFYTAVKSVPSAPTIYGN